MNEERYTQLVRVPALDRRGHAMVFLAPHAVEPALAFKQAVESRGGVFLVNSATRTVAQQQPFRDAYEAYLRAYGAWKDGGRKGKEPARVAAANKPGKSGHQGGVSMDVATIRPDETRIFPEAPANKQVDLLWEAAAEAGWKPIIDKPDEAASERWHFDCHGPWRAVRDHQGATNGYLCAALDVGQAGEWQSDARLIQALLLRAGYDIGEPDGIAGSRTKKALGLVGADPAHATATIAMLRTLPYKREWVAVPA